VHRGRLVLAGDPIRWTAARCGSGGLECQSAIHETAHPAARLQGGARCYLVAGVDCGLMSRAACARWQDTARGLALQDSSQVRSASHPAAATSEMDADSASLAMSCAARQAAHAEPLRSAQHCTSEPHCQHGRGVGAPLAVRHAAPITSASVGDDGAPSIAACTPRLGFLPP
jgi:hypothetical protein